MVNITGPIPTGCGKAVQESTVDFYYVRLNDSMQDSQGAQFLKGQIWEHPDTNLSWCGKPAPNDDWIILCITCLKKTGVIW